MADEANDYHLGCLSRDICVASANEVEILASHSEAFSELENTCDCCSLLERDSHIQLSDVDWLSADQSAAADGEGLLLGYRLVVG